MTPSSSSSIQPKQLLANPVHCISFGFGSGLSPWAPGTMGTLATLPLVWWLSDLGLLVYSCVTLGICVLGVWTAGRTATALGVHDHGAIVIDEVAGMLITMIGVTISPQSLLLGFGLFRLFDIVKPWPIKLVDRKVAGGIGVMADDILAGIAAAACLQILLLFTPMLG